MNKPLCPDCAKRNGVGGTKGKCSICSGKLFGRVAGFAKRAKSESSKVEFSSFSVSSRIPREFEMAEEELWDEVGVSKAVSLKTDLNGRLAEAVMKELKKGFEPESADVVFLFDFMEDEVRLSTGPIYIYGHYRKFSREISQTKWPCDCRNGCELCGGTMMKYLSVEDLVAGPLVKEFGAKGAKFHGAGREDVDARMLGDGRPFLLEIEEPTRREVDLRDAERRLNEVSKGRVEVSQLSVSSQKMVELVKMARLEKSYRAIVETTEPIGNESLTKLPSSARIKQKTPKRVLHRRADLERVRDILEIRSRPLSSNSFELELVTESGTYVKEFISGDGGRTKPSVSEILGTGAVCRELDVIKIKHGFLSDYW